MKIFFTTVMLSFFVVAAVHAAEETRGIEMKAHDIIELKCTKCHSDAQINAAFTAGKDMDAIVKEMELRGAKLSGNEREVLGIFWKKKESVK